MKKILIPILTLLLLASCSVYKYCPPRTFVGLIDYRSLTEQGIYITESNSVNFDYVAIGSVYVEKRGGWIRKNDKPKPLSAKDDYYIASKSSKYEYTSPDLYSALDDLKKEIKELNANGVINLKITLSEVEDKFSQLPVEKITVSGMVIKK